MTPTRVTPPSYAPVEVDINDQWPGAGEALLRELRAGRGRPALIAGATGDADALTAKLTADLGLHSASLGGALAERDTPPTEAELTSSVATVDVLTNLDLLFSPELRIAPLPFLAARARRHLTIAAWPGVIENGRARYSAAGRPDHFDERLSDVVVLHPRPTRYPDEVPFVIEEIAP